MRAAYWTMLILVLAAGVTDMLLLRTGVEPAAVTTEPQKAVTFDVRAQLSQGNTVTITPPAGQYVYITGIDINR